MARFARNALGIVLGLAATRLIEAGVSAPPGEPGEQLVILGVVVLVIAAVAFAWPSRR